MCVHKTPTTKDCRCGWYRAWTNRGSEIRRLFFREVLFLTKSSRVYVFFWGTNSKQNIPRKTCLGDCTTQYMWGLYNEPLIRIPINEGPSSTVTLSETNIAPENQWLEDDSFLLKRPIFKGYVSFRKCTPPKTNMQSPKMLGPCSGFEIWPCFVSMLSFTFFCNPSEK